VSPDYGEKISYLVLEAGTPVYTSDGQPVGTVKRLLAVPDEDIYDGLILDTDEGDRFIDAPHASELHERGVVLDLTADQLHHLPEPTANPAALEVQPDDTVKHSFGEELGETLRKAWDRISGNY
jgi:hypothetical protein